LLMYVVSLTPLELAGKGSMRWAFRALFVPTEQQLARLPVEELTRPSHATIEEQAFYASQQPRVAPVASHAPPAPVVQQPPLQTLETVVPTTSPMAATTVVGVASTATDIDLQLNFDDPQETQLIKPENSEKAALMAYLQSLAYPDDTPG
jgi:hypothetical protein